MAMARGLKKSRSDDHTEIAMNHTRQPSVSSASVFSRQPPAGRAHSYRYNPLPSPPASSYFNNFAGENEQLASPEATSHFAYSTTLRRHSTDEPLLNLTTGGTGNFQAFSSLVANQGAGIWDGLTRAFNGQREEHGERLQANAQTLKPQKETPSSQYAHNTVEEVLGHFRTSIQAGLPSSDIPSLREVYGYNEFSVSTPEPMIIKFIKTIYESPLIMLLFGSAIVSAVMGNIDDAVSITVAILIVLTVAFVQEQKSEKSLEALNKLVPHHCHLIRDGQPLHVLANELVPGDLVTFGVGDRIPADIRLVTALDLEIDESSLTGETHPASKDTSVCNSPHLRPGETVALADRTCIAYMGTLVRNGRGSGIVVATGVQTEFGAIFSMMQDVTEKRTPLQLQMDELAKKLSIVSFGVIGVICIIGVLQHRPWLDMFTIGVSLAVAAIPEGLPIVTTVTLALGVLRMAKRNAIVKKLPSVESLGSVSVICSDKTGTLTLNEQTVAEIYVVDENIVVDAHNRHIGAGIMKALEVGSICNNAFLHEEGRFVGHSTDVALLNVLSAFGATDSRQGFSRLSERPFNSAVKYMAVSGSHSLAADSREKCYVKGALEVILSRCGFYYVSDDSTPGLDEDVRMLITNRATAAASRGLRVIALAYGVGSVDEHFPSQKNTFVPARPNTRPGTPAINGARSGGSLVFAGFQAMFDPPRKGVADAISLLQAGGVQVVMITGDSEHTAVSIGRELGLRLQPGTTSCMTGQMLDGLTKSQLMERVASVSIFARTTPRHKMAIVEAFQARGAIVAMTGDGVNDAPALKMADIGVSMGKSGTDVSKEAADVILVDDNFSTILSAVEEGKTIFSNIQNFLAFQLSTAVAALTLITMSTFFGLSNPLNAMQILFINILMDGPPSQSLGVDPVDPAVMRRPPRKKSEPILSRQLLGRVLFSASMIIFGTLWIYIYALSDALMSRRDQTMTFTSFVFLDLVSALQNRGLACGIYQNKLLLTSVSVSFAVQLAFIYVPFMQAIFQTEALSSSDFSTILMLAAVSASLHEVRRWYERRQSMQELYYSAGDDIA